MHGALFINRKKSRPEHPDRTGTATINGIRIRISGWIKHDRQGDAYLSLAFTIPVKEEEV